MKNGFSIKLALSNIRKHRRLFVPYMLAGAGLVAVFFIVNTLAMDTRLGSVRGGAYIRAFMAIGVSVTGILSVVLIFYTNSFLMKQRKREFGIYNILGMEKKHVNKIVFWETLISATSSVLGGLLLGAMLYKLCVLFICKMVGVETVFGFYYINFKNFLPVIALFGVIYLASMILNMFQIIKLKPIELLKSSHVGEREPKIKWILLVVGTLSLAGGYGISIFTENPLAAIAYFFIAVFLVIIGTYCLFVAGSIALLKLLKKKKNYYYNRKHMVAVSGLLYRMKQNAVGLASIAIMATCVLVMISSTFCLYAGTEDGLNNLYPTDVSVYAKPYYHDENGSRVYVEYPEEKLLEIVKKATADNGLEIKDLTVRHCFEVTYMYLDKKFVTDQTIYNAATLLDDLIEVTYITSEEYERLTGINPNLKPGEIAYYRLNENVRKFEETVNIADRDFVVAKELDIFPYSVYEALVRDCYGIVTANDEEYGEIFDNQLMAYSSPSVETWDIAFNYVSMSDAYNYDGDARNEYWNLLETDVSKDGYSLRGNWDSRVATAVESYAMNGTLFFLGIILTIVFLFATALVIYYKQISEGYDDRERFQIMQKVGMSSDEVKGAIKTQVLLMFFLPLFVAGVHMAAAFPIIYRLLGVLFMTNLPLFICCVIGAYLIFMVIYVAIYILTTKVYYHIVR